MPPAFLVGCHRSGTTLVRYLLDSHESLACPPESKFIAGLQAFIEYPQVRDALLSLGFDDDAVRCELRRIVETFLGGFARRQGKSGWVDKTPNYYRLLPFIDDIFGGEALYLFLVRHPLDCAESLRECYEAAPYWNDPEIARSAQHYGRDRSGWARYWNEVYEEIHAFWQLHPNRCLQFKYEDLTAQPSQILGQVLAFLGESLPDGLIETALLRDHALGFEDGKIRDSASVHTGSIGKWRAWPLAEVRALWSIVGETASRFGYPPPL